MLARMNRVLCSSAAIALTVAVALPAAAQNSQAGGRWEAWLGCWTPAGTLIRVVGRSAPTVVCVVPTAKASAVDVMAVSGGKVVDSTHVDADGQPHAITKDGCSVWQNAKWSPTGRRVYLKSEFNCKDAATTHVSAVYAMAGGGEWIDVQGMRVEKNSGVHSVRYREATDEGSVPPQIAQKLHERTLARMSAMLAATEPPSLTDVEEASRELDPNVVSTWLIEVDKVTIEKPAPLNGKEITQLADRGVPASVIDVMVGLSYPNVLTVNPVSGDVSRQNADSVFVRSGYLGSMDVDPIIGFDRFGYPIYASQSLLMQGCSPWMYGPYDAGWNLYSSQFGCGGYGFGAYGGYAGYGLYPNYGYGRGYFGGGPVVVPVGSGGAPGAPAHGHVVNGKGYTQGGSGDGTATRSNNTGSTTSGSGSGSSSSPPPPPPPRTAVPKKP